jgi:transcriptional regulator with XRE-family HTH domain
MTLSPRTPEPSPASLVSPRAGSEPAPTLAAHVRDWRATHGLTHGDLARRLGVARTTVRNWELGRRPQPLQLEALARLFGWDDVTARMVAGEDRVRTKQTSGGRNASPLCRARLAAGLTMTQVANRVGVTPACVSRWENGLRRPSPTHLPALTRALRVTPERLAALLESSPTGRWDGVVLPSLGELRRDLGWTQRAFAAAVGIGSTTANRWEHGRVRVPESQVHRIAEVLGVEPADLIERAVAPMPDRAGSQPALARMRLAAGMTQQEAAHHVGISVRTLRRFEHGRRRPGLAEARALARCFRRPLAEVLRACGVPVPPILLRRTWAPADLPAVLEALRASAGLSAAELGRRLGTSGRQVRAWERGVALPGRPACQRLELLHQLPPDRLSRLRADAR